MQRTCRASSEGCRAVAPRRRAHGQLTLLTRGLQDRPSNRLQKGKSRVLKGIAESRRSSLPAPEEPPNVARPTQEAEPAPVDGLGFPALLRRHHQKHHDAGRVLRGGDVGRRTRLRDHNEGPSRHTARHRLWRMLVVIEFDEEEPACSKRLRHCATRFHLARVRLISLRSRFLARRLSAGACCRSLEERRRESSRKARREG